MKSFAKAGLARLRLAKNHWLKIKNKTGISRILIKKLIAELAACDKVNKLSECQPDSQGQKKYKFKPMASRIF